MNSIRALQNFVRRSLTIKPKATQPPAGSSSAKTACVAQASADNSSATSSVAARGTTSPTTSRPTTARPTSCTIIQDEHGGSSDTSSADDERPKLQPKHQKDRRRVPAVQYTRPDYAAQVVFEKFDNPNDPMTEGYAGTLGGIRYGHSAVEEYMSCGTGGGYFLTCGHAVVADNEACGTNCKIEMHEVRPFNCPQCHDIVKDILNNSLTIEERARIDFHRTKNDGLSIALAVEYVTKRLPAVQRNITETLFGIMSPQYGRKCLTVPVESKKPSNLAEMFQEEHSTMEEKIRTRLAEEKFGPLKTAEKRKDIEDPAETPKSPEAGASYVGGRNKKQQKKKPETHRGPVTEQTRVTKRAANCDGELPNEETSGDSAFPAANTSKKLKMKLQAHRQPITIRTRGEKRKQFKIEIFAKSPRAIKRVMTSTMPDFGGVAFLPAPPVNPWFAPILPKAPEKMGPFGQLERKRVQDLQNDEDYSPKRQRSLEELPGSDADVQPLQGKRMTSEEWAAAHDDDEL